MFPRVKNQTTINKLIEEQKHSGLPNTMEIVQLLESTKDFLAHTSPRFPHDQYPEKRIIDVLNKAGTALENFKINKDSNEAGKEAYSYCKAAITERLEELQASGDKFAVVYQSQDNILKLVNQNESATKGNRL